MRKLFLVTAIALMNLTAVHAAAPPVVDVWKSPYCGCCGKWVEHMRAAGFEVMVHNVTDLPAARAAAGMPDRFGACHSAKIGGYAVEGHVPATDVKRLLAEHPSAIGIAVPSMPPGSPGMEGTRTVPYDTILVFGPDDARVFAKH